MELIRIENLFKTYFLGEVDVPVLKGVSLSIQKGEMVALMGVSGSGKSTLMNILGLLDRPTSGSYWLNGQEVSRLSADRRAMVRNRNIGFVFQSFNLLPRSSAVDQVRMPLVYAAKPWSNREERRRAVALLEHVGLGQRLDHEPSQLSGGQQQRVAISRALVNHPPILLADEPTGNLDSRTSEEILQMFQRLNKEEGISVILVTHDLNVARHANRIIYIRDGLIDDDALAQLMAGETYGGNGRRSRNGHSSGNGHSPENGQASGNGHAQTTRRAKAPILAAAEADDMEQSEEESSEAEGDCITATVGIPAAAASTSAGAIVTDSPATIESPARQHQPVARRAAIRLLPRTLTTALHAIRRNTFRSILTTLGIVMGIGAVIAMMEIGQGSATAIQKTISSMGANRLIVIPGSVNTGGVHQGSGSVVTLTPTDCDAIMRECPAVIGVAPFVRKNAGRQRKSKLGARLYRRHDAAVFANPQLDRILGGKRIHRSRRRRRRRRLHHGPNRRHESFRRRISGGQGRAHPRRGLSSARRAQPQGGQHVRQRSRRSAAGPLDDDQVSRQLDRRASGQSVGDGQRQSAATTTLRRPSATPPAQPILTWGRIQTCIRASPSPRRPTRRNRCDSSTSIRSWSRPSRQRKFQPPSIRSPNCCTTGIISAPMSPTISWSAI